MMGPPAKPEAPIMGPEAGSACELFLVPLTVVLLLILAAPVENSGTTVLIILVI